jgi:hypothetical protein
MAHLVLVPHVWEGDDNSVVPPQNQTTVFDGNGHGKVNQSWPTVLWLPSHRPAYSQEGSPYTVISPDGEWLGQVETPARFRILDVTGGLVLGVLRDEMDVENVVVYEVVAS